MWVYRKFLRKTKTKTSVKFQILCIMFRSVYDEVNARIVSSQILDSAENDTKLRIKELLHILSHRPELNKQLGTQSSYEIKTLIIQAYPQFRSWGMMELLLTTLAFPPSYTLWNIMHTNWKFNTSFCFSQEFWFTILDI